MPVLYRGGPIDKIRPSICSTSLNGLQLSFILVKINHALPPILLLIYTLFFCPSWSSSSSSFQDLASSLQGTATRLFCPNYSSFPFSFNSRFQVCFSFNEESGTLGYCHNPIQFALICTVWISFSPLRNFGRPSSSASEGRNCSSVHRLREKLHVLGVARSGLPLFMPESLSFASLPSGGRLGGRTNSPEENFAPLDPSELHPSFRLLFLAASQGTTLWATAQFGSAPRASFLLNTKSPKP
jgi:hypothetical protein